MKYMDKKAELMFRGAWTVASKENLSRIYHCAINNFVVHLAPLTRMYGGYEGLSKIRVYYKKLTEDQYRIKDQGVISFEKLMNLEIVHFEEEEKIAFQNIPLGSVYLKNRPLEEILAMETGGATVDELKRKILGMYESYKIKAKDIKIVDYDSLPEIISNEGIFRVKYQIKNQFVLGNKNLKSMNRINVKELDLDKI